MDMVNQAHIAIKNRRRQHRVTMRLRMGLQGFRIHQLQVINLRQRRRLDLRPCTGEDIRLVATAPRCGNQCPPDSRRILALRGREPDIA